MSDQPDHHKDRRFLNLEKALASEPDSERALRLVLQEARLITGERYAALGVLDEERLGLERFVTCGLGMSSQRAIGGPPRGRGVLGVLIAILARCGW
jgi:hypothetical protein